MLKGFISKIPVLFLMATTMFLGIMGVANGAPPNPLDFGPYEYDFMDIDQGCNYDLDGTSLVWSDSPFYGSTTWTVAFGDTDFSGSDTRCGSPSTKVDMEVRVWYPGKSGKVADGGPFPFVAILHGQQIWTIEGYKGYDYLGQLLASHGFIVASIDGRSLLDSTIKSRGEHVREHLRRFVDRNEAGSGHFLEGQIDLDRTTVIGHSRGGDAVVATWEWQRVDPDPGYTIVAIVAIAPVQFFARVGGEPSFISHARDVAYQIIHGSKDGDVSDFQGYRQYDRAADIRAVGETPKSLVFVKDANHNFFNSIWETLEGDDYCCGGTLSGTNARNVAKVYIHSFLQVVVNGDLDYLGYLTGEYANPIAGTTVNLDYQAPGSEFLAIDNYEELPGGTHDKTDNSCGGAVTSKKFEHYDERRFSSSDTSPFNTYKGETYAGYIHWTTKKAKLWNQILAACTPDPTVYPYLSFRIGQIYRSSGSPNPPGNQDLFVQIVDGSGVMSALVKASDYPNSIYPPWLTSEGGTKTVMGVVRIPLSAFTGIDLTNIQEVRFRFNNPKKGEIVVDNVCFTK